MKSTIHHKDRVGSSEVVYSGTTHAAEARPHASYLPLHSLLNLVQLALLHFVRTPNLILPKHQHWY